MTTLATILAGAALAAEKADFDETAVTPGVIGFIVTALFAVAVILLGADLVRRVRRSQYRAEIERELAAELAEREASEREQAAEREQGPGHDSAGQDSAGQEGAPADTAGEDREAPGSATARGEDPGDADPGVSPRA